MSRGTATNSERCLLWGFKARRNVEERESSEASGYELSKTPS